MVLWHSAELEAKFTIKRNEVKPGIDAVQAE